MSAPLAARPSHLRPAVRGVSSVVSVLAVAAACTGADAPADTVGAAPLDEAAFRELTSPAGPGSAEPFVTAGTDAVWMSWLEPDPSAPAEETIHRLRLAQLGPRGWGEPVTVAHGDDFFVNWADFPSVAVLDDGTLLTHWLQRSGEGTYAYGVRVARSHDDGATWSPPWTPHDDVSPTEHGFTSFVPAAGGGADLVWLDGRKFADGDGEMTLRARSIAADGSHGPDVLVDDLVCDCCQTDGALTDEGPVVVYRDRSPDEVRDIYITRRVDGRWEEGRSVHDDGWVMPACPVNGPAVAARGRDVVVAWYAAPDETPQVKAAFSRDAGATFGSPVRLDAGAPGGRVDVALLRDGSALVTWLERVPAAGGGVTAEIRARRVDSAGRAGEPRTLARSTEARASGFPRLTTTPEGDVVLAWTDVLGGTARVRVARLDPSAVPEPGA